VAVVPSKSQVAQMKKNLEGGEQRILAKKAELIQSGMTQEEAERVTDPMMSYYLRHVEEVQEYEEFYRMEEDATS
jgi:hypothetical protein